MSARDGWFEIALRSDLHVGKQRHGFRCGALLPKIQTCLLVAVRMLLPPQDAKKGWPIILDELRPRDFRVACKTECEHQFGIVVPRYPMMNGDRALPTLYRCTTRHRAAIAVAGEHDFPVAAEVFRVLSLQRVAGSAKTMG